MLQGKVHENSQNLSQEKKMKNVSILAIHAERFSQTMNLWKTKEMKGLNMHAICIIIFPKKKKTKV